MYETAVYTHVDGDVRKVSSHKTLYFTHLPRSPPWMDCHQIWLVGWSHGPNQLCQIFWQLIQGFQFCRGRNCHCLEVSRLTQCYCAGCATFCCSFFFFCFRGEKFLMLPYVVKGMDVSFSGILSHLEEQVGSTFMEQGVCIFVVDWRSCGTDCWLA